MAAILSVSREASILSLRPLGPHLGVGHAKAPPEGAIEIRNVTEAAFEGDLADAPRPAVFPGEPAARRLQPCSSTNWLNVVPKARTTVARSVEGEGPDALRNVPARSGGNDAEARAELLGALAEWTATVS
jgi:hypothetical protein